MRAFAQKPNQLQLRPSQVPIRPPATDLIKTKLAIGKPGDQDEYEADRVAEEVMRMPQPQSQRVCACGGGCPDCQTKPPAEKRIRVQGTSVEPRGVDQVATPPVVNEVLSRSGQPLNATARAFMESRFGHDFSRVRVHADELAGRSAHAVAAQAYTAGFQVVFGRGHYAPTTPQGQRLLAHELAHVVQQSTHEVIARQPILPTKSPKAPVKSEPVFHPGVMHNHQPSGRWADVQDYPDSSPVIEWACGHYSPLGLIRLAARAELSDKPLALDHLHWFLSGSGAEFVEDTNLALMLRTDTGVQEKLKRAVPSSRPSGYLYDHVTVTQDDYADDDFKNAFGEIDRLDFEVDFDAGTLHAWFQDRYEWHPVYPYYTEMPGDYKRGTNCVHAAAVELKSKGAKDYWMKGEATIPLKEIQSAAKRRDRTYPPVEGA